MRESKKSAKNRKSRVIPKDLIPTQCEKFKINQTKRELKKKTKKNKEKLKRKTKNIKKNKTKK